VPIRKSSSRETRLAWRRAGKPLQGVAQVAIQQGRYVGRLIAGRPKGKPEPPLFKCFNEGNQATVGRN
jgi:NADH dehydrogenase